MNRALNAAAVGLHLARLTIRHLISRRRDPNPGCVAPWHSATALAACLAALPIAACGPDNDRDPGDHPRWIRRDLVPASSIAAAGTSFVLHVLDHGKLEMISLNPATGNTRWHAPATPSYTLPGVGLQTTASADTVVWLRPVGDYRSGATQIVAANPDTGTLRWAYGDATLRVASRPRWCGPTRLCVGVTNRTARQHHRVVLDARTGLVVSRTAIQDPRELTDDLLPARNDRLQRLNPDGTPSWTRPVRALFGRSVSPDNGWNLQLKDGRYVGWLGGTTAWTERTRSLRLGAGAVAGFDAATGRRLWTRPSANVSCGAIKFDLAHPVLCLASGTITYLPDGTAQPHNINVTLQRFDPATGSPRRDQPTGWSWNAGPAAGLVVADPTVIRISATTYPVTTPSGQTLLDLDTGPRRPPKNPRGWCTTTRPIKPTDTVTFTGPKQYHAEQHQPCGPGGTPLEAPPSTPDFAGARNGTVFAWPSRDGIAAHPAKGDDAMTKQRHSHRPPRVGPGRSSPWSGPTPAKGPRNAPAAAGAGAGRAELQSPPPTPGRPAGTRPPRRRQHPSPLYRGANLSPL